MNFRRALFLLSSASLTFSPILWGKGTSGQKNSSSPAEELKSFEIADGFVIELVASEENGLINPIDLTFDDAGRLWTQTAQMYPHDPVTGINFSKAMKMMQDEELIKSDPRFAKAKRFYQLKERGSDKILIIDNPTQQAQGPLHIWADGLTIPQSILPYKNGCYVAHGSEMFFLEDSNGDGKQDAGKTIYTNFGFFDTHTMSHSFVRAPGGQVHFSQGAINTGKVKEIATGKEFDITFCKNLRFDHGGTNLEIINCWKDNIWGYQLRANGEWYGTSANDSGYSVMPMEPMSSITGIGNDKIRPYQPYMPPLHKFRVGGSGISGLAFSEDGASGFPAEWQNVAILANPITRSLNCVKIHRNADGSVEAELIENLLKSSDRWFRPVNLEFGPDGCLYIADWYNKIIAHNGVTTDHPDRDKKHGRIWRIRHTSQKPRPIPNLIKASNAELVKHLEAEILWEKRAAWHQIVDRGAKELAPSLQSLIQNSTKDSITRIHAFWAMEGLEIFDQASVDSFLQSGDDHLVREALRALSSFELTPDQVAQMTAPFLSSENAMVRAQLLRTLRKIGSANPETIELLVDASKPAAPNNNMGGNYERNFERFLALMALEDYRPELQSFIDSPLAAEAPATNLLWASQALPKKEQLNVFKKVWEKGSKGEIDPNTFAAMTSLLSDPEIVETVTPTFKARSEELLKLALATHDRIDGPRVAKFYDKQLAQRLNSSDSDSDSEEALDAILKLRSTAHSGTLMKLLQSEAPHADKLFTALGNNPRVKAPQYLALLNNEKLSSSIRIKALTASSITGSKTLLKDTEALLKQLDDQGKKELVERLSWTNPGVGILLTLYENKTLSLDFWDYRIAQRTQGSKKEKRGEKIITQFIKEEKKAAAERSQKVDDYVQAFSKIKGNPATGKALFSMCLACHQVNGEGQNIAPTLDGSGNRNLEHLLTAIVNPDEAIEGAYGLYFVVKKNGEAIEGYRAESTTFGVTIAIPGGTTTFIANSDIYSQGGVTGKSFMPTAFDNFPEQTMADLISYIQSL